MITNRNYVQDVPNADTETSTAIAQSRIIRLGIRYSVHIRELLYY